MLDTPRERGRGRAVHLDMALDSSRVCTNVWTKREYIIIRPYKLLHDMVQFGSGVNHSVLPGKGVHYGADLIEDYFMVRSSYCDLGGSSSSWCRPWEGRLLYGNLEVIIDVCPLGTVMLNQVGSETIIHV